MSPAERGRIGYVVKVYPRFSETFIVSEILAREAAGEALSIYSLRTTQDARFHPELARVAAPVTYLPRPVRPSLLWDQLREAQSVLGEALPATLGELLREEPEDAAGAVELACRVIRDGITHLHAHFANAAATVARLASLLTGVPYSFTAHAKDLFHESVDHAHLRRLIAGAAHVTTVSAFNVRFLTDLAPECADRIQLAPNAIEVDRFAFRPAQVRSGPLHVVAVGRLVEKKGFDVLLDALALMRDQGTEARLTLAGGGELAAELAAQVESLRLSDRVRMTGPVPQDEIGELLRSADVFAAPCVIGADGNADGLPTVLLEAMAVGVPCVSTAVTGIPEVVIDGETGLLCQPGDVAGLAEALTRLARGDVNVEALITAARTLVEQRHDARTLAATHRELTARAGVR